MRIRRSLMRRRSTLLFGSILCWLQFAAQPLLTARAQDQRAKNAASADASYELRTYEVGDLVLDIQDHAYGESLERRSTTSPRGMGGFGGGGLGGGGGGAFSIPDDRQTNSLRDDRSQMTMSPAIARSHAPIFRFCQFGGGGVASQTSEDHPPGSARITIDDLRRVITTTIAVESWATNGTGEGQVEPLGTSLVVWQAPSVHQVIEGLLNEIRQGSSNRDTLSIDARWLLLDSDELDALLQPTSDGISEIDEQLLAKFTRRPGSIRAITNCFSSQLVYLVSGTRRNVVTSYIPVVGQLENPDRTPEFAKGQNESLIHLVADAPQMANTSDRSVGYQPVVEKANLGALLEIRPTKLPGLSAAVVDLKSTITVSGDPTRGSDAPLESLFAPQIDRISIEVQEFATTLRVPLGRHVLVGGLTHVPAAANTSPNEGQDGSESRTQAATAESRQLYLVLKVR